MFKSLYAKVILLFLAIVVSILGLGYYVISTYLGNYLRDRVQEEMHRVAVSSIHLYNEMTDESFTLVLKGFFFCRKAIFFEYIPLRRRAACSRPDGQ